MPSTFKYIFDIKRTHFETIPWPCVLAMVKKKNYCLRQAWKERGKHRRKSHTFLIKWNTISLLLNLLLTYRMTVSHFKVKVKVRSLPTLSLLRSLVIEVAELLWSSNLATLVCLLYFIFPLLLYNPQCLMHYKASASKFLFKIFFYQWLASSFAFLHPVLLAHSQGLNKNQAPAYVKYLLMIHWL